MNPSEEFEQFGRVRRRSAWYGPVALVLIFIVVIMVMSLFFRVRTIEVINASEYTDEEIIAASGLERGDNLFFVDRFSAASLVFSDLPYMDAISIQRQLPNKIIIQAEGSAPAAYMQQEGEYWLIDRRGKMLGTVNLLEAESYPEVRNISALSVAPGEIMMTEGADTDRLSYMDALLSALQAEHMIGYVSWMDFKNVDNPSLRYDGRLTVYLGTQENVPYKAALLKDVLSKLSVDDTGALYYAGGSSWTFSPD